MRKSKKLKTAGLLFTAILALAIAAQSQTLERVWSVPPVGTFYSMQLTNMPPLPFLPDYLPDGTSVYLLSADGTDLPVLVYDDTTIDYAATAQAQSQLDSMNSSATYPPDPWGGPYGSSDTNIYPPGPLGIKWATTDFRLEITNIITISGTKNICLNLYATIPYVLYEVLSKQSLTDALWTSEASVIGAPNQDWTPALVPIGTRPNSIFLWARSWADSDGSGMPDWWQIGWFGSTGVDPYGDDDNDGWTNLQEYQNGTNPKFFDTPPPPRNALARLDSTGTNVLLTWETGGGPVSSYVIRRIGPAKDDPLAIGTNSPSNLGFTDAPGYDFTGYNLWLPPTYMIRAYFTNGTYSESQPFRASTSSLNLTMWIVRGPDAQPYLTVASPPANLALIRLFWQDGSATYSAEIYPTNLHNGTAQLPQQIPMDWIVTQTFDSTGQFSEQLSHFPQIAEGLPTDSFAPIFTNLYAPAHLTENLKFLLRSATLSAPFRYASSGLARPGATPPGQPSEALASAPQDYLARPSTGPGYEYYGFRTFSPNLNYAVLQPFRPVQENVLWRNLVYDPADFGTTGIWTNGVGYITDWPNLRLLNFPHYTLPSWTGFPLPLLLTGTNSSHVFARWVYQGSFEDVAELGLVMGADYALSLPTGRQNLFGLPIASVLNHQDDGPGTFTLQPGWPSAPWPPYSSDYFSQTAAPSLQTVDYYFASQTPYFHYGAARPPLPGSPDFAPTNTSPLLLAPFGEPFSVAAWAKQTILNGYPDKFAYLEQYFDRAYKIDTNGNPTTNVTGLLSPYGEFFPTEPGPVAITTMPDIETGRCGTGTVNVIKLQLDVNHDGTMDLSLGGPDNTTPENPFLFWVNNDRDEPQTATQPDRDMEAFPDKPNTQDWFWGHIRSKRNLEDFARLRVCGVPPLPENQGYSVTLSLVPITGYPALNLYASYDTAGSSAYLTDPQAAAAQFTQQYFNGQLVFDYARKLATIDATHTYEIPRNATTGDLQIPHFIFEGAGRGTAQLLLRISKAGAILAQTSAWIDFRDVLELYEQAIVTNVQQDWPQMVQESRTSSAKVIHSPSVQPKEKQLAVFIHGWRISDWSYLNFSDTMYKRLYWQGFQGKFAALRWPTRSTDTDPFLGLDYATYNRSEHIAFASGTGTAAYLNDLRRRHPDFTISVCAHSMGAITAMEALNQLSVAAQTPLNNYVLMQAAVPAHCYDTSVTNLPALVNVEFSVPTPDTYRNYAAPTLGALRPGGHLVNFFNPVDYALAVWELNQGFYAPDTNGAITMKPNTLLGYYTDGTTHQLRTNIWNQSPLSILYRGYYGGPVRAVTNLHEIMPFVARPRSRAVGAQPGVQGQIHGSEMNLQSQLTFGSASTDHSGQWNRNIQDPAVAPFFFQLRQNLFPPPP